MDEGRGRAEVVHASEPTAVPTPPSPPPPWRMDERRGRAEVVHASAPMAVPTPPRKAPPPEPNVRSWNEEVWPPLEAATVPWECGPISDKAVQPLELAARERLAQELTP